MRERCFYVTDITSGISGVTQPSVLFTDLIQNEIKEFTLKFILETYNSMVPSTSQMFFFKYDIHGLYSNVEMWGNLANYNTATTFVNSCIILLTKIAQ